MKIPDALRRALRRDELNFGRDVIPGWVAALSPAADPLRILDVGVGNGDDLLACAEACSPRATELHGLDWRIGALARLDRRIRWRALDVERETWPYADASFDVVLSNQTLEHTKEIFWVWSETLRVLAPGGLAILGVPNLASLHNRVLVALGEQPSSAEIFGSHVRAMTIPGLRRFVEAGQLARVERVTGSSFYPFPPLLARPLARLAPGLAVSIYLACRRLDAPGRFVDLLDRTSFTTRYFRGE